MPHRHNEQVESDQLVVADRAGQVSRVPGAERSFLGHPRGLAYLTATEAWSAFSLYGTLSLLVLYMVSDLLLPANMDEALGLQGLAANLDAIFGKLTAVALASAIFGLFAGLICFTPLLGGLLADRWLGQRLTVTFGAILMISGYAAMMSPRTFIPALLLLILGSGCITGNVKAQLSRLYKMDDPRRPSGFAVGLIGINLGAFAGPLVCGTLGELYGWHLGFGAAASGMAVGLAAYLTGSPHLGDGERPQTAAPTATARGRAGVHRTMAALGIIFLNVFYYGAYNQTFNMFPLWVRESVDRQIAGVDIPVTWFLAADALFAMIATLITILLWRHQARRSQEPHDLSKLMIGFFLITCAFAMLMLGEIHSGPSQVNVGWCIAFFVFTGSAAPFMWASTLSLVSRLAPASLQGTAIGAIAISAFAGNLLVGWSGQLFEKHSAAGFWMVHSVIAGSAVLILLVTGPFFAAALARTDSDRAGAAITSTQEAS